MSVCYCLQFSINYEEPCELTYTNCEGNLVTEIFSNGQYSICSQDLVPESPCPEISFYVNGLCVDGECVGSTIKSRNECDPITIFPMGVQCLVDNPTNYKSYDGSASLYITGGTPPYTTIWDIGSVTAAITNLGVGEYGATVIDYYGDFTARTTCVLTVETPSPTPTPTPSPTPTPGYDDICFVIKQRVNEEIVTELINFNYNGVYNNKPTWISDDTIYNIIWVPSNSQWEISGWTVGSIVNINPNIPPLIGWQSIGGLGNILSIKVGEGSCNVLDDLTFDISKNDPTCECNGSIIIDVTQGNSPYLYSVDGGRTYQSSSIFNNLCYGEYSVIVVDDLGFANVETVTLSEPPPTTQYTLQLNLDRSNGVFNVSITPPLPIGTSVNFDFIHTKHFQVSPTNTAASYTNDVTLIVDGSPLPISTTSNNLSVFPLDKCESASSYNTTTNNNWQNITMISGTMINGTISDVITPITPLADCYNASGWYNITLNNAVINNCNCCDILVINPANKR